MEINKDLITLNEVRNDGKTIHLYFNGEIGMYVAYGYSAFYAAHIVNMTASFSESLQMPVALMRKREVSELRMSTLKREHDYHRYYRLELRKKLGREDYVRWADSLKWE